MGENRGPGSARSRRLIWSSTALLVMAGLAIGFWVASGAGPTRVERSGAGMPANSGAGMEQESLRSRLQASLRDGRFGDVFEIYQARDEVPFLASDLFMLGSGLLARDR